ncbi:hypothetical protein AMECASPLE_030581 [Ameca splendens]|uniref:Uncharacterized protein n=1 Tax=Ameca splendens TaxID=208324 RepID=A0ABV0Y623_9TELE
MVVRMMMSGQKKLICSRSHYAAVLSTGASQRELTDKPVLQILHQRAYCSRLLGWVCHLLLHLLAGITQFQFVRFSCELTSTITRTPVVTWITFPRLASVLLTNLLIFNLVFCTTCSPSSAAVFITFWISSALWSKHPLTFPMAEHHTSSKLPVLHVAVSPGSRPSAAHYPLYSINIL